MSDGLNDLLYQERATNRELEATCLLLRNQVLHLEGEVKRAAALREAVVKVMRWTQPGIKKERWEYDAVRALLSTSPPPPDHVVDANKKVGTFEEGYTQGYERGREYGRNEGAADMQARIHKMLNDSKLAEFKPDIKYGISYCTGLVSDYDDLGSPSPLEAIRREERDKGREEERRDIVEWMVNLWPTVFDDKLLMRCDVRDRFVGEIMRAAHLPTGEDEDRDSTASPDCHTCKSARFHRQPGVFHDHVSGHTYRVHDGYVAVSCSAIQSPIHGWRTAVIPDASDSSRVTFCLEHCPRATECGKASLRDATVKEGE